MKIEFKGFNLFLTLIFVVLKMTHVVDWQWKWVLAPLWIPFVLFGLFLAIWAVLAVVGIVFTKRNF